MFGSNQPVIILASNSSRRRELLTLLLSSLGGGGFSVVVPRSEPPVDTSLAIDEAICNIALAKARDVAARVNVPDALIIAADTAVVLDGAVILGKPENAAEAAEMLKLLSGKTHEVITGAAILKGNSERVFAEWTEVTFRTLSETEITRYVASGEPLDKAGAYGIQGKAAIFIEGIKGDYYNVMGLPICRLATELAIIS
ncbi:MAG: Maf family protein [Oscillospiraceae bacterium]|jgi:septum formation protein|nr:Maf family protein [Oscillospiraceae bacterium]